MGLRLAEGIVPEEIRTRFGLDRLLDERPSRGCRKRHLSWQGERLRTTVAGRLLLDHILARSPILSRRRRVIRSA
jgi:hypothetical protein